MVYMHICRFEIDGLKPIICSCVVFAGRKPRRWPLLRSFDFSVVYLHQL